MIEFVTLFLAISTGIIPVELTVSGPVAAVEIQLDGEVIGTLEEAPWRFRLDLGPELWPRSLVAVARDARGRELDQARRWINVAAENAGAALAFVNDDMGRPRAVKLTWESVQARELDGVEVLFDGQPLEVRDLAEIPLPSYDRKALHVVEATVRFGNATKRLAATFGGRFGEEVASELTALPVIVENSKKELEPEDLEGWFVADGEPLVVHDAEKGPAEIVIVRALSARPEIDRLARRVSRRHRGFASRTAWAGQERGNVAFLRQAVRLGEPMNLGFMSPLALPLRRPETLSAADFPSSGPLPASREGLFWHLLTTPPSAAMPYIAEAVAMAGRSAHASGHRGAVLLILGDGIEDHSQMSPAAVRSYLEALRVPLYVWSLSSTEGHASWGEVVDLGSGGVTLQKLSKAAGDLSKDLAAQRVVWIGGQRLPQDIELSSAASGLRLTASTRRSAPSSRMLPAPVVEPEAGSESATAAAPEASTVETGLTPLLIFNGQRGKLPSAADFAGRFTRGGQVLEAVQVERGSGQITIIRDPSVQASFESAAHLFYQVSLQQQRMAGTKVRLVKDADVRWFELDPSTLALPDAAGVSSAQDSLRRATTLGTEASLRFYAPIGGPVGHMSSDGKVFWRDRISETRALFTGLVLSDWFPGPFQPADAVIAAGRELAATGQRRAVVLLLAEPRDDMSAYTQAAARAELARLGVPLFVWAIGDTAIHSEWGEVRRLRFDEDDPMRDLDAAVEEVRRQLMGQYIVHLQGRHPVAEIELSQR